MEEPKTLGVFEKVEFPELGFKNIYAKIDTGAYSGALHCTKIREVKTSKGRFLEFSPFDRPRKVITVKDFTIKDVKSSNGVEEYRYFIKTKIKIGGSEYDIRISLADRRNMTWPVLIGRRFLQRNNFVVDAKAGTTYRNAVKDKQNSKDNKAEKP